MTDLPRAHKIEREARDATDAINLTYDARLLRRKRLTSDAGRAFIVDLPEVISLNHGDAFVLEDGTKILVQAADEALLKVRGHLPRLAWHIGNRHAPCEIADDHLLIQADHVMRQMLEGLGADVAEVMMPFSPEGGAYGEGRTFAHSHVHD
ncbi:urease accessory protein UreE [Litoreibacter roseus]|uniref:Urease accessory protein UreE n=1 Tax=Litoreibacter roseus TaxID=2601869 RepID=A0A6N6JF66_9RHOB|nr:urease accessory protein UreE [Litoreibacter roseus]GFE64019.1 hypothetical protein KIN_10930 [Litoreibacter roseus]